MEKPSLEVQEMKSILLPDNIATLILLFFSHRLKNNMVRSAFINS